MMTRRAWIVVLVAALLTLTTWPATVTARPAQLGGTLAADADESGPALATPVATLDEAVRCSPLARRDNPRPTVLLVHGTASTPEEVWGWSYERQLTADRYGWCDVRLPSRALGNFTVAAEYAVHAARVAHQRSGRDIALVGHSQGAAMVLWIAKFWPDVARHASDVIALAGPLRGTTVANALCITGRCAPLSWQMTNGGHTMTALEHAPMPHGLAVTSIATRLDELITPQPAASSGAGIHTIMVQDVCPGHVVDHALLSSDPVAYQLMIDAVDHSGTADPARFDPRWCTRPLLPETNLSGGLAFANVAVGFVTGLANPLTWVNREPTLPSYAQPYGG